MACPGCNIQRPGRNQFDIRLVRPLIESFNQPHKTMADLRDRHETMPWTRHVFRCRLGNIRDRADYRE